VAVANRKRDLFGDDVEPLFDDNQGRGAWWDTLTRALVSRNKRVQLSTPSREVLDLQGEDAWTAFFQAHIDARDDESSRRWAERCWERLGISFASLTRFLDDVAVSPDADLHFDARRGTPLATLLKLYGDGDTYALWTDWGDFYGDEIPSAPLHDGAEQTMQLALVRSLDPGVMKEVTGEIFGRDREEVEAQADFFADRTARELFDRDQEHTGPSLWAPLDLSDLDAFDWDDETRLSLLLGFHSPVHPEKRDNGEYADRNQPFLEVYLDTADGLLQRNALSLRARQRPEQNRGLIQMKLEREPNPNTGHPVREKWERRFRGPTYLGDVLPELDQMITFAQVGHALGAGMPELKKLHVILRERGALGENEALQLRPDHIIFQRRRRGRLELDELATVRARVKALEDAENAAPHEGRARYLEHARAQLSAYEAAATALAKYTEDELGGEAIIVSADRWSVFEPGAWPDGRWPDRLGAAGRRGRGLRFETELDAWTSEVFADALKALSAQHASASADERQQLDDDRKAIEAFRDRLWHDVNKTVEVMTDHLTGLGARRLHGTPPSKSLQATEMLARGQGFRRGHRYWVD